MKECRQFVLAVAIVGSVWTTAPAAESPSVLLQRGIFAEETERNLDAAIKIYQQITAEAAANRTVVAQAHFRLGVCYQKKGNQEQAISVLNGLLRQFPDEAEVGQKARALLAELGQAPSGNVTVRQVPLTAARVYSVSLDGQLIAYRPKENHHVAVYETATGRTWSVKQDAAQKDAWFASLSPDGRRVASQTAPEIISGSISIARIDGSEAKQVSCQLKDAGARLVLHGWAPDGEQLIVRCENEKSEDCSLCTLDAGTETLKEVKRWTSFPYLGRVSLSSNGRYLAYRLGAEGESRRKICVLDLESGSETALIEKGVADVVGWWSGDARLLFLSSRSGTPGLWAIPVREGAPSGEPELMKANVGDLDPIGITRDGSIYFTESTGTQYEGKSLEYVCLATADFETGEIQGQPRRVTDRYLGKQSVPVWSADGQRLMFAVPGGEKRFVAVSPVSGEQKEFPVSDVFTAIPQKYAWSPDGTFLLALSYRTESGMGIYRYQLDSGATERLVERVSGQNWPTQPRFSPDGNSFYYANRKFSPTKRDEWHDFILRRDLRSGREEIVYESPETLQIHCPYELSPDGKHLALVTSEQFKAKEFVVALKVRAISDSETKELVRLAPRENITSLAWSPDGNRLVYTKELTSTGNETTPQVQVWSIAVDSGQSVELKFNLPGICDLSLQPHGGQIAFGAGMSSGQNLWVMEGLMPTSATPSARATEH